MVKVRGCTSTTFIFDINSFLDKSSVSISREILRISRKNGKKFLRKCNIRTNVLIDYDTFIHAP
jgi:hypothetical protein